MAKTISTERKDKRKRLLKTGESLRKDGRYAYKYVGTDGKPHFVYFVEIDRYRPLAKGEKTL